MLRIGASGPRSSCDSVARNSSLRRSASRRTAGAAARLDVDARQQLARAERLDQVVVGSGIEPFDPRLLAGARREQDHRDVAGRGVGAQLAQEPEAVEPRHHDVGEDEVRPALARGRQRASPSGTASTR